MVKTLPRLYLLLRILWRPDVQFQILLSILVTVIMLLLLELTLRLRWHLNHSTNISRVNRHSYQLTTVIINTSVTKVAITQIQQSLLNRLSNYPILICFLVIWFEQLIEIIIPLLICLITMHCGVKLFHCLFWLVVHVSCGFLLPVWYLNCLRNFKYECTLDGYDGDWLLLANTFELFILIEWESCDIWSRELT